MKITMQNAAVFLLVGGFRHVSTLPPCDHAEANYVAENRRGSWVISIHENTDYKALARDKQRYNANCMGLIVDTDSTGLFERIGASLHGVDILNRL